MCDETTKHKTTRTEDDQPTTKTAVPNSTRHPQKHNQKAATPAPSKPAADRSQKNQERINTKHQKKTKQKQKPTSDSSQKNQEHRHTRHQKKKTNEQKTKQKQKQGKKQRPPTEENAGNEKKIIQPKTTEKNPTDKTDH